MDQSLHYIELSNPPIRFDAVSQLTNVFFDDTNKQVFSVRSGGATGIVVKGPTESSCISFCMTDRGPIRSIKLSPDNNILAVQRKENAVEFIILENEQPLLQDIIVHPSKTLVYGFVWVHNRDCALISNTGIEIFTIITEKRQVRSVKSSNMSIKWFAWCGEASVALICSDLQTLTPVLIKQKSIIKLPKLDLGKPAREVQESKVTLGQVYGMIAVLLLHAGSTGRMEVEVYLLNGPGLTPHKCHVLLLGHLGRFAINIVDNLIVVHHQASATSLLFDIALSGEVVNSVTYHSPITPGRSICPFALRFPSLSGNVQSIQCELYSSNWVLFQPNVVIDAKLGCMWYLNLCFEHLCMIVADRIRLTELLLQRSKGKLVLFHMITNLIDHDPNGVSKGSILSVLEVIFNKINKIYAASVQLKLQTQIAQPSNTKISISNKNQPSHQKVIIEQAEMMNHVFENIRDANMMRNVLKLYLQSLTKNSITAQEEFSKMIILQMIKCRDFGVLREMVSHSLLYASKATACYLLSHSKGGRSLRQVTLDMLSKIKAFDIISEVLLGEGKVIDALRMARRSHENSDFISARKFLEAAQKTQDHMIFHSVFKFFQLRNLRLRGSLDFLITEQCNGFVELYKNILRNDDKATVNVWKECC